MTDELCYRLCVTSPFNPSQPQCHKQTHTHTRQWGGVWPLGDKSVFEQQHAKNTHTSEHVRYVYAPPSRCDARRVTRRGNSRFFTSPSKKKTKKNDLTSTCPPSPGLLWGWTFSSEANTTWRSCYGLDTLHSHARF